jgi:hypothetical protein
MALYIHPIIHNAHPFSAKPRALLVTLTDEPAGKLIRPPAATTRCHGKREPSGSWLSVRPTHRAARPRPASFGELTVRHHMSLPAPCIKR